MFSSRPSGAAVFSLANSTKLCYTYDSQSRVTKRTIKNECDEVISEETYAYDAAGNVTGAPDSSFQYDTNNCLVSFNGKTVSYDLDGNMLSNGSLSCIYDSANRLISAGGHTYTYNAEDVRIRNLCGEYDTTYTYNTNCKLSQLLCKTTNGITTKYVYGRGLIGEEKEGCFKTYHFDYRGSTVAITDMCGNITDTFAYDTYGKLISRTGSSFVIFGYNGRDGVVTDKNGLIYMRARYYSPDMRRFINADILAGKISESASLNRYAYVNGNPVSMVDPFGLSPERTGPSVAEAAYMAQQIYSIDQSHIDKISYNGWVLDDIHYDDGLKIAIYARTIAGVTSYAVVNEGSTDLDDWINNFQQPFGCSDDMWNSISFARTFVERNPNSHITFIGHSKGGAEAAANAVATNRDAILFNPASVSLNSYGLNSKNYTANMTAYIVEGEILNTLFGWASSPIDEVVYLPNQEGFWGDDHSMSAVRKALEQEGYS